RAGGARVRALPACSGAPPSGAGGCGAPAWAPPARGRAATRSTPAIRSGTASGCRTTPRRSDLFVVRQPGRGPAGLLGEAGGEPGVAQERAGGERAGARALVVAEGAGELQAGLGGLAGGHVGIAVDERDGFLENLAAARDVTPRVLRPRQLQTEVDRPGVIAADDGIDDVRRRGELPGRLVEPAELALERAVEDADVGGVGAVRRARAQHVHGAAADPH